MLLGHYVVYIYGSDISVNMKHINCGERHNYYLEGGKVMTSTEHIKHNIAISPHSLWKMFS